MKPIYGLYDNYIDMILYTYDINQFIWIFYKTNIIWESYILCNHINVIWIHFHIKLIWGLNIGSDKSAIQRDRIILNSFF